MGAGAKRKSRGVGGARCNRLSVGFDNQTYNMLKTLSISCDLSISELVDLMVQDVCSQISMLISYRTNIIRDPNIESYL